MRNASITTPIYLGMLFVGAMLTLLSVIPLSLKGSPSVDNRIERNAIVLSILSVPENGNSTENIVVVELWKEHVWFFLSCF